MKNAIIAILCFFSIATNAQSWKELSSSGLGSWGANNNFTIAIDNNDNLYAAYRNSSSGSGGNIRNLEVKMFTGTSWINVGSWSSPASNTKLFGVDPFHISLRFDNNNVPYVCYNRSNSVTTVRKYVNGNWEHLGGVNTGVATGNNPSPSLVFDAANTPYVGYNVHANNNSPVVKKYNSSNNTWSALGTISTNKCNPIRLVMSSSNTLYAVYRDISQSNATVIQRYNSGSNTWSQIGSIGRNSGDIAAITDSNDSLYVAFSDHNNSGKLTVRKYTGSGWLTLGAAGFSAGSVDGLSIAVSSNDDIYVGYIDGANSNNPTVKKFDGTSWVTVGVEGFTSANHASSYGTLMLDNNDNVYMGYNKLSSGNTRVSRYREKTTWRGTGGQIFGPYYWDNGIPDDGTNVIINCWGLPDGFTCNDLEMSFQFGLKTGHTYTIRGNLKNSSSNVIVGKGKIVFAKNGVATLSGKNIQPEARIVVNNGTTLFIDDNTPLTIDSTLELAGNLSMHDNATLDISSGKLLLNGTTAQTLNLGQTVHKYITVDSMELNNSAGASFGNGIINIKSVYLPASGTLVSNNRLRLISDATGTARIAAGSTSGGYITGNIMGRLYIPGGRRAFRFIAHAAGGSRPLNQFTDEIDITGSGGSANGFTNTQSNNPSAFYFDVTTADNSTAGNNPGWQPFTSATSLNWDKGEVMRLLIRGSKGEGLTGGSYTPSATTLAMYETVNQGDQTVTLTKGTNTNFVLVGNPFPSQVQLNTVARGSNVGANFYVWDANQGVKGGYTSHQFTTSYVLPQWGAFVTTVSANTNNTMVFEETDKTGGAPAAQFKGTGNNYVLKLAIDDTSYSWDNLLINFDNNGYAVQDKLDAVKLNNPGLDFYTVSKDGTDLSIDVRPMNNKEIIPVGVDVWHYGGSGTFTITTKELNLPTGATLTFYDKYLNKQVPLTDTFSYTFTVSKADSMSGGKNRFQIGVAAPTSIANTQNTTQREQVQVYPNPTDGQLHIAYKGLTKGTTTMRICDVTGRVVYSTAQETMDGNGLIEVNTIDLISGMYIVELKTNTERYTKRFIKN